MKEKEKLLTEQEAMSVEDCIKVLENIKKRGKGYPTVYALVFTKEYCEKLAEVEALAIDTAISMIQEKERNKLKRKSDKSCDKGTNNSKKPIVPILLGFILGGLFGKLLILILKIAGVL